MLNIAKGPSHVVDTARSQRPDFMWSRRLSLEELHSGTDHYAEFLACLAVLVQHSIRTRLSLRFNWHNGTTHLK